MIATLEKILLLDHAEDLAKMILQSEAMANYYKCLGEVREDREAQQLIKAFNDIKDKYEEVQRFGKYHPDYQSVSRETRELKRKVDLHDTIYAFKQAEKSVQELLDEISVLVGRAVSEHIKVPTGNPFFDSLSSCGGGCGSGGGCSCSA